MATRRSSSKPSRYTYLASACLAGINCTYTGHNKLRKYIKDLVGKGKAIAVCPEVMGGLPIPRKNSEIVGGDGKAVLRRKAHVLTSSGRDVTRQYLRGAKKVLAIAKCYHIKRAILKSKSPACGCGRIYDGTFRHVLMKGDGILAALLQQHGIRVFTEKNISRR